MDRETKEILDEEIESAMESQDQDRLRRVMARGIATEAEVKAFMALAEDN